MTSLLRITVSLLLLSNVVLAEAFAGQSVVSDKVSVNNETSIDNVFVGTDNDDNAFVFEANFVNCSFGVEPNLDAVSFVSSFNSEFRYSCINPRAPPTNH